MINRCIYNSTLTIGERRELASARPRPPYNLYKKKNPWDCPPNDSIKNIKKKIRKDLENSQKVCAYCGLKLRGTSKGQVEHIAPKAYFRDPEFTFTSKNLALACNYCNSPSKKGTKKTIINKNRIYSKCEFLIVHPYFDDPDDHYEWTSHDLELLIQVKDNSCKGKESIDIFGLADPDMCELRAGEFNYLALKIKYSLTQNDEDLLSKALDGGI